MKDLFIQPAQEMFRERRIVVALIVFVTLCLAFIGYVAFNIQPSELKIVSHYSTYGATNFYRDSWVYLLSFIGFGITVLIAHILLALRLFQAKGADLAYAFVWLSVIIMTIAFATVYQVLRIAALA